jgi:hypothetical protein
MIAKMFVAAALLAGSAAALASDVSYDMQQLASSSLPSQKVSATKGAAQSDAPRAPAMSCGCHHTHS